MITSIYFVIIVVGIVGGIWLLIVGDDRRNGWIETLGGLVLLGSILYSTLGLLIYHDSEDYHLQEDFTPVEVVEYAEEMECFEVVLRLDARPQCVTEDREVLDFTQQQARAVFWPINLVEQPTYAAKRYRNVTSTDVQAACGLLDGVSSCVTTDTVVVIEP